MAKAIAEYLFGNEDAMLRIDCPALVGAHTKNDLVGHDGVYQGSGPGKLTGPVSSNPHRVILFDEVEKADPVVFDIFLPLMGEGRLDDQFTRKTVDFTKCIIILTSNAHADEIGKIHESVHDHYERENAVKSYLADTRVFKPEIIGRIDRIYVFSSLPPEVQVEIILLKLSSMATKSYGLTLAWVEPELIGRLLTETEKMKRFGTRASEGIIKDLFATPFARLQAQGVERVICRSGPDGNPIVLPEPKETLEAKPQK
jgi:ATP-dependent Clp protease ATP-binding subunit ClpC